jgi:hypothetical protein
MILLMSDPSGKVQPQSANGLRPRLALRISLDSKDCALPGNAQIWIGACAMPEELTVSRPDSISRQELPLQRTLRQRPHTR